MTSRTTPVGVIVVALFGLIVIGCGAPTSAVFQALIAPAGAALSSPAADQGELPPDGGDADVWWQHPDGYAMTLPAGWLGVAVDASKTDDFVAALRESLPGLADRVASVLAGSKTRISAVAYAADAAGHVSPVLLVLAEPADGRRPHAIKTDVYERISSLPGLSSSLSPHGVTLLNAKGERYDFTIVDPDLLELRVRSFVFRFGRTVYLVNFIASADVADGAGLDFDAIIDSLRFGV
jgi:hypothetical protein